MAHGRDIEIPVLHGEIYRLRGYVTKDLSEVFGKGEIHQSLETTAYSEAVHRRDSARVRYRQWIGEERYAIGVSSVLLKRIHTRERF